MKIAVLYNNPAAADVMQRRGAIAREVYSARNVERIRASLEEIGHEAVSVEADRHILDRFEAFFGPFLDNGFPGLVFNIAYGIQGQLRYCHLPGLLEMLGLPYLGSGPLGHALASDKAATKTLCTKVGVPTPEFVLYRTANVEDPDFGYPLVVKPVAQAMSIGVRLADDVDELHRAVRENLERFHEPVMVERFVPGREISVAILGNDPGTALPPVEVILESGGPPILTQEDKQGKADRGHSLECPAQLSKELTQLAQSYAVEAFGELGCRDWARVDFRLGEDGRIQLLEVNTIPGLGEDSSLPAAAREAGHSDFHSLLEKLIEIAVTRWEVQAPARTTWSDTVLT